MPFPRSIPAHRQPTPFKFADTNSFHMVPETSPDGKALLFVNTVFTNAITLFDLSTLLEGVYFSCAMFNKRDMICPAPTPTWASTWPAYGVVIPNNYYNVPFILFLLWYYFVSSLHSTCTRPLVEAHNTNHKRAVQLVVAKQQRTIAHTQTSVRSLLQRVEPDLIQTASFP